MPQSANTSLIEVWAGTAPGQPDPSTHFWYKAPDTQYRRICDDSGWPTDTPLISDRSRIYVPCRECRSLYVDDIVHGDQLLDPILHVTPPFQTGEYPLTIGGYSTENDEGTTMTKMTLSDVPVATFARFYEATGPQKVRMVRDSRLYQSDPRGYIARDYYLDFRNTLRQTHWATNDIATFEAALDGVIDKQKVAGKREHYRQLGDAYINFWKKREGAEFFNIEREFVPVAGLSIRVGIETGVKIHGDELAVKFSFAAPRPTRAFRQVVQHLTGKALTPSPMLQPVICDVRREELLPTVPIPKDFQMALEGQAGAFRQIWESLDGEET